jgi:hypothetical protein
MGGLTPLPLPPVVVGDIGGGTRGVAIGDSGGGGIEPPVLEADMAEGGGGGGDRWLSAAAGTGGGGCRCTVVEVDRGSS